jgi:hypothetical protein
MDGGELRAFFRGAADDTAQTVESAGNLIGEFDDKTAQKVLDSIQAVQDADSASADAIRAAGKDATGDLPGSGSAPDGAGSGTSRIADLLNGNTGPEYSATFGHTDSFDYKKTFFDANPETSGEVVVHHAVEQQAIRRYPDAQITPNEMHSLENLRGVPKGEVNSRVHLSELRKEWNRFYRDNPAPAKQDLLKFATQLDKKYGHEFNPPIK